jgi:pyrimidine oxygenase
MQFSAQHVDYAFVVGDVSGDAVFNANRKLRQYAEETGRDVGAYVLYTLVSAETEAEARAKSAYWSEHADRVALVEMMGQAALDAAGGTASVLQGIAYIGITPIIGSYAQCAATLDHIASIPGTKGIMLIFPECLAGLQECGERVLPLMRTAKLASPRPYRVRAEALTL